MGPVHPGQLESHRKLTLDYGLRWDYATYGHEEHGLNPISVPPLPTRRREAIQALRF
jgi:hypothetical protein